MVVATAAARNDSYCALAWGSTLAGLSDDTTAARLLQGVDGDLSDREAALAASSRHVVHDPNATTEADVDRLRDAGFNDQEIFEATTWIALRLAFSTINGALGAPQSAACHEGASARPQSRHLRATRLATHTAGCSRSYFIAKYLVVVGDPQCGCQPFLVLDRVPHRPIQ